MKFRNLVIIKFDPSFPLTCHNSLAALGQSVVCLFRRKELPFALSLSPVLLASPAFKSQISNLKSHVPAFIWQFGNLNIWQFDPAPCHNSSATLRRKIVCLSHQTNHPLFQFLLFFRNLLFSDSKFQISNFKFQISHSTPLPHPHQSQVPSGRPECSHG